MIVPAVSSCAWHTIVLTYMYMPVLCPAPAPPCSTCFTPRTSHTVPGKNLRSFYDLTSVHAIFVSLTPWSFNAAWFEVDGVLPSPPRHSGQVPGWFGQLPPPLGHAVSTLRLTNGHVQNLRLRLRFLPCQQREDGKQFVSKIFADLGLNFFPLSKCECYSCVLAPCLEALDVETLDMCMSSFLYPFPFCHPMSVVSCSPWLDPAE